MSEPIKVGIMGMGAIGRDVIMKHITRDSRIGARADIVFCDEMSEGEVIAKIDKTRAAIYDALCCSDVDMKECMRDSSNDRPPCIWQKSQKVDYLGSKHRGGGKSKRKRR